MDALEESQGGGGDGKGASVLISRSRTQHQSVSEVGGKCKLTRRTAAKL